MTNNILENEEKGVDSLPVFLSQMEYFNVTPTFHTFHKYYRGPYLFQELLII